MKRENHPFDRKRITNKGFIGIQYIALVGFILLIALLFLIPFTIRKYRTAKDYYGSAHVDVNESNIPLAVAEYRNAGHFKDAKEKADYYARFITPGSTVLYGTYEQDNNLTDGKEPIEWYVVAYDPISNISTLVSKSALDYRKFDAKGGEVWEESSLREWLNTDFCKEAFEEKELESEVTLIPDTKILMRALFPLSSGKGKKEILPYCADATAYAMALSQDTYDSQVDCWMKNGDLVSANTAVVGERQIDRTDIEGYVRPMIQIRATNIRYWMYEKGYEKE